MSSPKQHLFELKMCGPTRGDCTAPYNVIFKSPNRHPTVTEFLNYVISLTDTWGYIRISPDQSYETTWDLISYEGRIDALSYDHGEWGKSYDKIVEKYGDRRIKSATADGGWSRMDYVIILEDEEKVCLVKNNIDIPTTTPKTYILRKRYIDGKNVMFDRKPVCACKDYGKIVNHAKELRNYILNHGKDDWFDQTEEPLVAWNGFNYFGVGTSDKQFRIVFTITAIPCLD